jgi:hypothetical protein
MLFRQLTMFVFFLATLSIGQADVRGGVSRRLPAGPGPCTCRAGTAVVPGDCEAVQGLESGAPGPGGAFCPGTESFNLECCVPPPQEIKKMMMAMMMKRK